MHTEIISKFGMERGDDHRTLTTGHGGSIVNGGQYFNPGADPLHDRGPDEHRVYLVAFNTDNPKVGFERVVLATERVTAHVNINR